MGTYSEFSKGSEWRKWDLHFHTPASHDYKDKSITDTLIIEKLIENEIGAVAITDHNFIDCQRIKKLQILANGKIVIFPGIEFCSELGGSESIHFIGIFPEHSDIESLWTKLQGKLALTPADITKRGGVTNIQSDLIDTCDIIHELGGITSIHAGTKTNTIENIKNTVLAKMEQKRRILSECIDILELGKVDDSAGYEEKVFKSIGFRRPMIICSDNHDSNSYLVKQNCWIKAEKTFEGLKQIIYEPEGRVKIQLANPSNKKAYNIIEKVKFIDDSWLDAFSPNEIGFSPDLNAIIGGKSSGKSLLLHSIAKAVGNETDIKNYASVLQNVDLEVYYADDPNQKRTSEDRRIIEFLPQLFIENIVRNKSLNDEKSNSSNFFNKFIEDLIRQNPDIQSLYDGHNSTIEESKNKLDGSIKRWITLDKELFDAKNSLKPLGDKAAIAKEITTLNKKVELLTSQSGLTEDEQELYTNLTESNAVKDDLITNFYAHKAEIERLREYAIGEMSFNILSTVNFETDDAFTSTLFDSLKTHIEKLVQNEIQNSITMFEKKLKKIEHIILVLNKKISNNTERLAPLLAKNKIQTEIEQLKISVKVEQEKLVAIEKKEKEIQEISLKRDEIEFIPFYRDVFDSYDGIVNSVNEKIGEKWIDNTGLTLTASVVFDSKKFVDALSSVINIQSYLENQMRGCGFTESNYIYDEQKHIENIKNILTLCIQDESRFGNFKKSGNTESLLRSLFANCWCIDFDIKKGNDSLQNMSEGKKGIVILQLYLSLSKSDCPILIDQPEDNLDNRTVYIELNEYIKQCKQRRQIIMVSHNANLVVNTDAENVIVANQAGEDGKENKGFKFEYVNGALENTFTNSCEKGILYQKGIREHVCEILEGGTDAFKKREEKYNLKREDKMRG
ncbi:hypothetical protein AGMMS50212_08830 [Spirochaetia bacterium]|nr:hypothetical protein AGMMS50212_08830 [Spirochaetia bacterium]